MRLLLFFSVPLWQLDRFREAPDGTVSAQPPNMYQVGSAYVGPPKPPLLTAGSDQGVAAKLKEASEAMVEKSVTDTIKNFNANLHPLFRRLPIHRPVRQIAAACVASHRTALTLPAFSFPSICTSYTNTRHPPSRRSGTTTAGSKARLGYGCKL